MEVARQRRSRCGSSLCWLANAGNDIPDKVNAAAFSPDGARVVTASADHTARVWELPLDPGSLDDWMRRARCAPFAFEGGGPIANHASCP